MEKKLNEEGLLDKNTYDPSFWMRVKSVLKNDWYLIPFLLVTLAGAIYPAVVNGLTAGTWAMIGLFVVVLGLSIWASLWHGKTNFKPFYTVNGIDVKFESPAYYVPPSIMKSFTRKIIDKFQGVAEEHDIPVSEMFKGVTLVVKDERPKDPLGRVPQEEMVGLSYTKVLRKSLIYGPYVLSEGGAGYELKLQGCGFLYPDRDEREDIKWMKEKGI